MSYCRFSSDDFQCDVYVYESDDGFVTHVADVRLVFDRPLPPAVDIRTDLEGWAARNRMLHEAVDRAKRVRIDLPSAGEMFIDDTAGECAARLVSLRAEGLTVPGYAVEALLEEEAHPEVS